MVAYEGEVLERGVELGFGALERDARGGVRGRVDERDAGGLGGGNGELTLGRGEGHLQLAVRRLREVNIVDRQARDVEGGVFVDREGSVGRRRRRGIVDRGDGNVDRLRDRIRQSVRDDVTELREGTRVDVVIGS